MAKQCQVVTTALQGLPEAEGVPVIPMLTFVKIEVGWIDSAVKIDEVWAAWPKEMDRLLRRPGTLGHEARARIAERLATTLRPA
jgi:hypothetical protein